MKWAWTLVNSTLSGQPCKQARTCILFSLTMSLKVQHPAPSRRQTAQTDHKYRSTPPGMLFERMHPDWICGWWWSYSLALELQSLAVVLIFQATQPCLRSRDEFGSVRVISNCSKTDAGDGGKREADYVFLYWSLEACTISILRKRSVEHGTR